MRARQIQVQAPTDWLYSTSVCSVQTVGALTCWAEGNNVGPGAGAYAVGEGIGGE